MYICSFVVFKRDQMQKIQQQCTGFIKNEFNF